MARNMLATLLLLFVVDLSFSAAPDCSLQKPYDHIAHTECDKYYVCTSQKALPMAYTCPEGYLFSKETKSCTWKDDVQCGGGVQGIGDCKVKDQIVNPDDDKAACNTYFLCDDLLKKVNTTCPPEQIFNKEVSICVPKNEWYCDQLEGPDCDDTTYEGRFLPIASDDAAYYICNGGVRIKSRCDATKYRFNVTLQSCVYKTATTKPVVSDVQSDISTICKGQTVPFVADPNVCIGYYYCMDENTPIWDYCPPGQYFYNGFCTKTAPPNCRCEDIVWDANSPAKVLKEHADKNKYWVCIEGKRPDERSCPGGFVFSLAEKSCVNN